VRALEAVARTYYKKVTGKDPEITGMPLGPIINGLRLELKRSGLSDDSPLGLIIANLQRMNNIYRKPLTHPEMILRTRDDARKVFDLAAVSITLLTEQMAIGGA